MALLATMGVAATTFLGGCAGEAGTTGAVVERPAPATATPSAPPVTAATPPPTPLPKPDAAGDRQVCFEAADPSTCVPTASLPRGFSLELQDRMAAYASRLHEALTGNENLLTWTWDPPTIAVAWVDPLPASLDPLIAKAAADGIAIVWQPIAMSQADAEGLMVRLADALVAGGVVFSSVGPESDHSGLRVGLPSLDPAVITQVTAIAASVVPDVTVRFVAEEQAHPAIAVVDGSRPAERPAVQPGPGQPSLPR